MKNTPCQLNVEKKTFDLTTDAEGKIDVEIPRSASKGTLTINDAEIPLKIGHLDPVEADTGTLARLANLGYYCGDLEAVDEMEQRLAVEEFQCDQKLKVTGELDPVTRAKLEEVHGC